MLGTDARPTEKDRASSLFNEREQVQRLCSVLNLHAPLRNTLRKEEAVVRCLVPLFAVVHP